MQSKAATVAEYLRELPADRRAALETVLKVLRDSLDEDYEEGMQYGMIGFYVPHRVYPDGYHCNPQQPLPFTCLASQKNYMSLYTMGLYIHPTEEAAFRAAWEKTGKKLDMGKSCIRFTKVEDLALEVIADFLRRMPARRYIELYESVLKGPRSTRRPTPKSAPKGTKKVAKKPASSSAKSSTKKQPAAKGQSKGAGTGRKAGTKKPAARNGAGKAKR